jgi:4-hydroxybenzoate polyprenyltransferase
MFFTLYQLIRTARPRQWFKNLSVFAPIVFAGRLLDNDAYVPALLAFISFCGLSSGVYFVNDIVDAQKDRLHPIKKNRPIASGKLSEGLAWISAFGLIFGSILFAYVTNVGSYFVLAMAAYVLMQISYSLYFRNVIILDSLVVAAGFVLRVFAGGFASATSVSSWLALTTIGVSLLLAFGKRRSEKTIVAKFSNNTETGTRATLRHYPDTLLDSMISMSAAYTIITYSQFVFQISPRVKVFYNLLPSVLSNPKWMMLTIPLVIYGVARYLYVVYEKGEGESPERVLLSDKPLLMAVLVWGAAVLTIIYALPMI